MKKIFSSLLVFIVVTSLIIQPVFAQSVAELRNEAKSAFRSGNYDRAASLYEQLVNSDPNRINILKEAMWAYWNMGKIPEAQKMADSVKDLSPEDSEAQKILGWAPSALNRKKIQDLHTEAKAAYQRGDYDDAARLFRDITALDPQNVTMLRDRMWILWNMKRVTEAAQIAEKVLRYRPGDRDAQSILDRAPDLASKLSKNTPASREMITELQQKLAADPDNTTAIRQLAWSLFNSGRTAEAETHLKKYLEINPDNSEMWMLLGKIQRERGRDDAANEAFQKSLELDPNQPMLLADMGRRAFGARDLDSSVKYFERAVAMGSTESKEMLPILAKSLFYRGEYRRSAEIWAQAVAAFPEHSDYRFHEAEATFYAGDEGLALARMRQLKYEFREPKAVAFLIDNAVARGDYSAAAVILAEDLDKLSIEKGRSVIRLALIYVKLNRLNNAISLLKRWVNFVPRDVWALLTLASIEHDATRYEDAIHTYERVLRLNPKVSEAHIGIANCYFSLGDADKGLEFLGKAVEFDPTNPYLIHNYASALFENGQRRKGRQMLVDWVKANANTTVMPILLYHGLTPFDDAPMLSYEIHTTVTSFESQMRSLREADYTPITIDQLAEWKAGKGELPPKPVFITFDDARMDSFRYADPILDQYGFKATMFVPLDDVESFGSIGYANWAKMQEYQKTGRWNFQAHGAKAHSKISVDSRGRKMLYLVMPKWLDGENRAETEEEWRDRIKTDHLTIRSRLKKYLNTDPIGYAWPEGNYGDHSDSLTAVDNNLNAIKDYFSFAFVQDQYGLNVPSQDSYFMRRIEPPKEWSGKDLITHISNQGPLALIYKELLEMATEEKKFSEANQYLGKLKDIGVSDNMYLAEKARINYASGRSSKAYELALMSFTSEPTPEVQKMLVDFKSKLGFTLRPDVVYQHDNEGRESIGSENELEIPLALQLKGLVRYNRTKFHEDLGDEPSQTVHVTDLGGGLELGWGDGHTIQALAIQQDPSGPSPNLFGYSATYWARWKDSFQTRAEAGREFVQGAQAINANLRENVYRLTAHFGEEDDWGVKATGRYAGYSDHNERWTGDLDAGYAFWKSPASVGLMYRYSYDDAQDLSEFYYTPQKLNVNRLGPQIVYARKSGFKASVLYLPGYSKEEGKGGSFAQAAEASLLWTANKTFTVGPSFYYEDTGHYFYNQARLDMEVRF